MNLIALMGSAGPAAKSAGEVDSLFAFILIVCLFFFFLTQGLLIYFAVHYRKRDGTIDGEAPAITHNHLLEALWIIIPSVVLLVIFLYGYKVFESITSPVAGANEVNVTGRQWMWEVQYSDGKKALNELRVPVNKPTRLVLTSADVIHSLYIPDFRVKVDAVPGRYTELWLTPQKTGEYDVVCAEFCGVGHSQMNAKLFVMSEEEYSDWLGGAEEVKGEPPAVRGQKLADSSGCLACHSTDGSVIVGPSFKGIFGRKVVFEDDTTATTNEDYLRESILDPNAKIVKGFQPMMPSFKGTLSEDDVKAIIEYLKTLK